MTKEPSYADIDRMVDESLERNIPLERLFNEAVFGGKPPKMWGDWPHYARSAWDTAARIWVYRSRGYVEPRSRAPNAEIIGIEQAWEAVCASSRAGLENRLSWSDIGHRLGIGGKAASYQFGKLGFVFAGVTGMPSNPREVVAGPCVGCGQQELLDELHPLALVCSECDAAPNEDAAVSRRDLGPYERAEARSENGRAEVGSRVG